MSGRENKQEKINKRKTEHAYASSHMQPKQSCGLRYPQQKLSNGPKSYIYIRIEPSELRKHKRESKSYLGQKLISSSFAPLLLLPKPPLFSPFENLFFFLLSKTSSCSLFPFLPIFLSHLAATTRLIFGLSEA